MSDLMPDDDNVEQVLHDLLMAKSHLIGASIVDDALLSQDAFTKALFYLRGLIDTYDTRYLDRTPRMEN